MSNTEFRLEDVRIKSVTTKAKSDGASLSAKVTMTARMTRELADTFQCSDQVFDDNGIQHTNFTGVGLKMNFATVKMNFSPLAGKPFNSDADVVDGFSIYPTDDGLELSFVAHYVQGLTALHAYHERVTVNPNILVMSPVQQQLPFEDSEETTPNIEGTRPTGSVGGRETTEQKAKKKGKSTPSAAKKVAKKPAKK